ncbi:Alkaline phosphatase synthesis sensor protein PhoR [Thalassovita autumnalis]|uniref:histidine kinase n=1 Tax=Thalassovita autumnalis TaxID=2072972 RepID=A0A0P1FN45_9RHOB|nr:sensor histidine kinase [Thalassovita autumnalis]CUH62859.1 Alkaline phosphatase synthesis sensor protein PhoR [Thalassovita autumnalis]CUH72191.1 Alkaline phosphatase synthesis sensor protein PhoR [Thalassovita autumnalis]
MALAERINMPQRPRQDGDVVLGDDFVAPEALVEKEMQARRNRRGLLSLNRSPLTRKIIFFNLIALNFLVVGVLMLSTSQDSLAVERSNALVSQAELIADVVEAQLPEAAEPLQLGGVPDVSRTLEGLDLRQGISLYVFDSEAQSIASAQGQGLPLQAEMPEAGSTVIVDSLSWIWSKVAAPIQPDTAAQLPSVEERAALLSQQAMTGVTKVESGLSADGGTIFTVATPVQHDGRVLGVVALSSAAGEIDQQQREELERVLQMFLIATLMSIGLSLVLASTIANPLSDLAAAAELGRARDDKQKAGGRIRIPDLTARPDEIGRLSGALRGMVSALYDRIDNNEQFAADVAHEIKNPLASLRSAVGSLRMVKKEEHREKLLDVIDHDVRRLDRLDRLVSDISNASRLDSELVKEEQEAFDLMKMMGNLSEYLGQQAGENGVDFITDLPGEPVQMMGLEARLAQVFVNLITNAISFCEEGDAIRVWARRRENRVLIVVEDTGPGIPEQALTKVFKRFYSERPENQFGNNSGLGLAISKQIVEAHGGVIWAENIRPTDADPTSEPLGARFVVGLPI